MTSAELTLSAYDMCGSILSLEKPGFIIRIRSLTFSSNFYRLIWFCSLFVAVPMHHDANTSTLVGEIMSG